MTKYGYFDDKNREYVITNPKTPVKWINYIGTLSFGGYVDHTGGSLLCKGDPALNRIHKYIAQMPSSDFKGSCLYLRTKEQNKYSIYSPFFVPSLNKYELFETHVGLGYNRIVSEIGGIRVECTIFIPAGENVEIRDIVVTNISGKDLEIDVIPVVEYSHPDALKQLINADWVPQTMGSNIHSENKGLKVLEQRPFMNKATKVNYLTSNFAVSSFESDRKKFLGDNGYGTFAHPLALENAELSNTEAIRGDNVGVLMHHLGVIKSGSSKRIIVLLGQEESVEKAMPLVNKYRDEKNVDQAFKALSLFWDDYLSKLQVSTPDASFNSMLNVHNPRQCYITKNWSRYLSLNQLGYGARGIGYRDSAQDVLGVMPSIPEEAKDLIVKLLHVQKGNGSAMHQFNPMTMVANEGDSREEEGHNWYSDDHLWTILSVTAYIKETGNINFLDEVIPYYEKDKNNQPLEKGTVLDHMQRSIEFTKTHTGKHGIPLLGFADWNDTVNLKGNAESIFTACLYGRALLEMIDLFTMLKKPEILEKYKKYYDEMKKSFNDNCWDGEWYVRWFEDNGDAIGSNKNEKGKLFINAISWPVMAGFATKERALKSLESASKHLNTKYGIKISWPPYNGFDWRKGGVTTYPTGAKENGGIFLHTNPWVMYAETLMGDGDKAFEYYNQVNPAAKNDIIDIFESAPYNYPQNILGDDHPQFGLGRNSWLSGTSSWMYTVATKFILGIDPVYEGLRINPCIPSKWDSYKVERTFRGVRYHITVTNPKHISKGVEKLIVNGKEIKGNIIPVQNKETTVEVVLGKDGSTDPLSERLAEKVLAA